MKNSRKTLFALTALAFLSGGQYANATTMTSGCALATTCSLEELYDGGSISIGDITFDNWFEDINVFAIFDNEGEIDDIVDVSNIFVTGIDPVATGNPNEFTLGLNFTTTSALTLNAIAFDDPDEDIFAEIELGSEFSATASGNTEITGVELTLDAFELFSDDSFVEVNLDELDDALNLQVFAEDIFGDVDQELIDDTVIDAATSLAFVNNIQTGAFVAGTVALSDYSILFTTIGMQEPPMPPQDVSSPSVIAFLSLGLAFIGYAGRRKI